MLLGMSTGIPRVPGHLPVPAPEPYPDPQTPAGKSSGMYPKPRAPEPYPDPQMWAGKSSGLYPKPRVGGRRPAVNWTGQ